MVKQLAALVGAHGGNWLESRMGRLGGEFAGILRCQVPADRRGDFETALGAWAKVGFAVVVKADPGHRSEGGGEATIELVGQDRTGIVQQVSAALARHEVNLEELETECRSAPMSGEMLFHAQARVWIPATCDLAALQVELERIAADLQVDLALHPAGGAG
ncbi:MAG: glycine cleavage system protein R [Verrucomicrobiae bacterium]|nr:glycine cleavage system protein R [Verrucomicrobiae bacterium]